MPSANVNGVSLAYEVHGESGPPLVMVHGSWVDRGTWAFVAPELGKHFRVLVFDRRGHSESVAPPGGTIQDDVADLAELLRHMGMQRAHVVGNSYGANVSLRFASAHPEMVLSLNVHEPPLAELLRIDPKDADMHAWFWVLMDRVRKHLELGHNERGAEEFVEGFFPGFWAILPEPVREGFAKNGPTFLDELSDPDSYSLATPLDLSRTRTLLTEGSVSSRFFPPILTQLAAIFPTLSRYTFVGAGHGPNQSHPSEFVERVTSFALSPTD